MLLEELPVLEITKKHIKDADTKELVAWFKHWDSDAADNSKFRFSTREVAIKRCLALLDHLQFQSETADLTDEEFKQRMFGEMEDTDNKARKLTEKHEKAKDGEPAKKDASASIAESWNDAGVRAARVTRHRVMAGLDGEKLEEYRSVLAAFTALKLPESKHIRFRGQLKKSGSEVFEWVGKKYRFELVA